MFYTIKSHSKFDKTTVKYINVEKRVDNISTLIILSDSTITNAQFIIENLSNIEDIFF